MAKVLHTDEPALNAAAVARWPEVYPLLVDYQGRAQWALANLNPDAAPRRLKRFRMLDRKGAWSDLDGNASGPDAISLVAFLADVDRPTAAAFLAELLAERVAA